MGLVMGFSLASVCRHWLHGLSEQKGWHDGRVVRLRPSRLMHRRAV